MKTNFTTSLTQFLSTPTFLILLAIFQNVNSQTLVIPPSPGNLSTVEHLTQSNDYTVEVRKTGDANYTTCFVYKTDNYAGNMFNSERRPETSASFTNFSFSGTSVDVRITTSFTANTVTVRPLNLGIVPAKTGNVITFTLSSPKKISIEVNNRLNPLFLFSDAPDVPNTGATYYYGPGIHNIGRMKLLNSNESVYIAAGAVVEGSFKSAWGSSTISIKGRGILCMGEWLHTSNDLTFLGDHSAIKGNGTAFMQVEGIIFTNITGWTVSNYGNPTNNLTHDNQYRNLKMVSWNGNTDGIWIDGDNNIADDCFIFNNDDAFMSHGGDNNKVSNCVVWGGTWGRLFWHGNDDSSNGFVMENIDVIGKDGSPAVILVDAKSSPAITLNDFKFRNIRIEERLVPNQYNPNKFLVMETAYKNVTNWLFENITLSDKKADEGDIHGYSTGTINGVTFRNLKMAGTFVTSLATANMDQNSYASNVTFGLASEMNVKQGINHITDGTGSYNFGNIGSHTSTTVTFTIQNLGGATLNLTGSPRVTVSGSGFILATDAPTTVAANGTATFQVRFQPGAVGPFNGTISIANNDADENPYNFAISGQGIAVNLITNPTFDTNTNGWTLANYNGAASTFASVTQSGYSGKACKTTITNAGTLNWHIQLSQPLAVTSGKTYTVKFKASAASARSIAVAFQQGVDPKTTWKTFSGINITTTPTTYGPFTFDCTTTDANNIFKFMLGLSTAAVYIDDVEIIQTNTLKSAQVEASDLNVSNADAESNVIVYPNPVAETLKADIPAKAGERIAVNIFDLQGRAVAQANQDATNEGINTIEINVQHLSQGTYIVKISTANGLAKTTKVSVLK